jgi:AraC-like DNA-binding protein
VLLSRNYPPSPALAPYIARHYVFSAALPPDFEMIDRLLSETAFVRLLLQGDWAAEVAPDDWRTAGPVPFFGANCRPMRVRVRGPFRVVGFALRPCGWRALFDRPASDFADRMLPFQDLWGGDADRLLAAVAPLEDDAAIVAAVETIVAARLRSHPIDRGLERLERIARQDSTTKVEAVADGLGITTRQLERRCLEGFGHTPKMVLRRSRFLDMATVMRGLGTVSDEALAELRYFDQSHRIREFRRFIGMTPAVFERTPTPLLTAGLQLRAERKAAGAVAA